MFQRGGRVVSGWIRFRAGMQCRGRSRASSDSDRTLPPAVFSGPTWPTSRSIAWLSYLVCHWSAATALRVPSLFLTSPSPSSSYGVRAALLFWYLLTNKTMYTTFIGNGKRECDPYALQAFETLSTTTSSSLTLVIQFVIYVQRFVVDSQTFHL